MLAPMIASFILVAVIRSSALNRVIRMVFGINAIRLLLRILAEYMGINLMGDKLTTILYLPLVYVTFGLTAYWLFRSSHERLGSSSE